LKHRWGIRNLEAVSPDQDLEGICLITMAWGRAQEQDQDRMKIQGTAPLAQVVQIIRTSLMGIKTESLKDQAHPTIMTTVQAMGKILATVPKNPNPRLIRRRRTAQTIKMMGEVIGEAGKLLPQKMKL